MNFVKHFLVTTSLIVGLAACSQHAEAKSILTQLLGGSGGSHGGGSSNMLSGLSGMLGGGNSPQGNPRYYQYGPPPMQQAYYPPPQAYYPPPAPQPQPQVIVVQVPVYQEPRAHVVYNVDTRIPEPGQVVHGPVYAVPMTSMYTVAGTTPSYAVHPTPAAYAAARNAPAYNQATYTQPVVTAPVVTAPVQAPVVQAPVTPAEVSPTPAPTVSNTVTEPNHTDKSYVILDKKTGQQTIMYETKVPSNKDGSVVYLSPEQDENTPVQDSAMAPAPKKQVEAENVLRLPTKSKEVDDWPQPIAVPRDSVSVNKVN